MTDVDLVHLAGELEAGQVDPRQASDIAAKVPAREPWGHQVSTLIADAIDAYTEANRPKAWAAATIAGAAAKGWGNLQGAIDVQARALAVLSLIEADEGHDERASQLRRDSERMLGKMSDPTPARFSIDVTAAQREVRLGRAGEAVKMLEGVLKLPSLTENQRAAAQAVLAGALQAEGRPQEAIENLKVTAGTFDRAGRPTAALEADLERAIHLLQAGETTEARAVLNQVAQSAAATGADTVQLHARMRLGVIAAGAGEHETSAAEFQQAAAAAKRVGDDANVVVALRNAGDELRMHGNLAGAEQSLNEALSLGFNPRIALDMAKAKYVLAVVRHQQGNQAEAERLLNEAEGDFKRKVRELGSNAASAARDHIRAQISQVESLRAQMSRAHGDRG